MDICINMYLTNKKTDFAFVRKSVMLLRFNYETKYKILQNETHNW
jgi:hypothetical protein